MGFEDFKLKSVKGQFGKNLARIIPMIEEITNRKMMPLCLFAIKADIKRGTGSAHIATISDDSDTENSVIYTCIQLLISKGYSVVLNSEQNDERSVATGDDSSTDDDTKGKQTMI
jgi:hypothetical protein